LENLNPDLIFLDINMAGLNGSEICRVIKENKNITKAKILIMSGRHDIKKIALACGADDFTAKPLSFAKITEKVQILSGKCGNVEI